MVIVKSVNFTIPIGTILIKLVWYHSIVQYQYTSNPSPGYNKTTLLLTPPLSNVTALTPASASMLHAL